MATYSAAEAKSLSTKYRAWEDQSVTEANKYGNQADNALGFGSPDPMPDAQSAAWWRQAAEYANKVAEIAYDYAVGHPGYELVDAINPAIPWPGPASVYSVGTPLRAGARAKLYVAIAEQREKNALAISLSLKPKFPYLPKPGSLPPAVQQFPGPPVGTPGGGGAQGQIPSGKPSPGSLPGPGPSTAPIGPVNPPGQASPAPKPPGAKPPAGAPPPVGAQPPSTAPTAPPSNLPTTAVWVPARSAYYDPQSGLWYGPTGNILGSRAPIVPVLPGGSTLGDVTQGEVEGGGGALGWLAILGGLAYVGWNILVKRRT